MTDQLKAYRTKRDFTQTPEPGGEGEGEDEGAESERGASLSFVIQKHAASHLHYDFRLELDGTLKSWAVPKGPSLDPAVKRMAVHVEDHPVAYGGFEGVIPADHYGAGTVIVWDRGTWQPIGDAEAGYRNGKLKFRLDGEKLQGGWTLVRMHGHAADKHEPWLLIKERDDAARPTAEYSVVDMLPDSVLLPRTDPPAIDAVGATRGAKASAPAKPSKSKGSKPKPAAPTTTLPETLSPELATLVTQAPPGDDWVYEIKFDGYRILARIDGDDVRLLTRNGNDWTPRLRGLAAELGRMKLGAGWLDGEIVVLGRDGAPDFGALQNAFDSVRTDAITYYVFDLPFHDGQDLRDDRLDERRGRLRDLLAAHSSTQVRFSEDFDVEAGDMLKTACRLHLEGVIGKRRDSRYVSRRSNDWIKLKCTLRQEFVIVGYTDPQGSRKGLGALMLALHDDLGRLRYAGNVGTGFDEATLEMLQQKLTAIETTTRPFDKARKGARDHWVEPRLVAEVSFAQWTADGKVRHAVFHGLRTDKPASAIGREAAVPPETVAVKKAARKSARTSASLRSGTAASVDAPAAAPAKKTAIRVTHPERIVDGESGATKQDVVDYYLAAAKKMLPHLARRPVALTRAPSGIDGHLFFQKHAETLKIPGLTKLDPAFDPEHAPMVEVDSFEALLGAAQMNVIEFHTWNSISTRIEQPDRMTFDLDPGAGVAWPRMIEAAQATHALLDELGLPSFLKTSGGKGLHIVVPIAPKLEWDAVKAFSKVVVDHLAQVFPDRMVAKSGPRNRVGKIFIDYLRNGRGATTACAFSLRARPGLGVSIPCHWDELSTLTAGDQWNLKTAAERLDLDVDPWDGYGRKPPTLAAALKRLGAAAGRDAV